MSHTPEDERSAAQGFGLCSQILRDRGFAETAAFYDEAEALCAVKAQVLEDIEQRAEDFREALRQSGSGTA